MSKFAKELVTSLGQAATHARGRMVVGMGITPVETPVIKAKRRGSDKRTKGRKHNRNRMAGN